MLRHADRHAATRSGFPIYGRGRNARQLPVDVQHLQDPPRWIGASGETKGGDLIFHGCGLDRGARKGKEGKARGGSGCSNDVGRPTRRNDCRRAPIETAKGSLPANAPITARKVTQRRKGVRAFADGVSVCATRARTCLILFAPIWREGDFREGWTPSSTSGKPLKLGKGQIGAPQNRLQSHAKSHRGAPWF